MADQPPILVEFGDTAAPIVADAYDQWSGIALTAFSRAQQQIDQLANFTIQPVAFNASFDPQIALAAFPTLNKPVVPTDQLAFNQPADIGAPPTSEIGNYQQTTAPTFTDAAPTLVLPTTPNIDDIAPVGPAPVVTRPDMPDKPIYSLPAIPTLDELNLPSPPDITLPTFDSVRPTFNVPIPDADFSFTPAQYVDALLDKTKATISRMLDGGTGLPEAVARALRDRAYVDADNEEQRSVDTAYTEFAGRGFEEPPGLLSRRITEARVTGAQARSTINRDVFIQEQTVAIENLRFAVTSGTQLEAQLMQLHSEEIRLQFEAAQFALTASIQVLNARISVFNAQMIAYQTDASVFRDLISAESARVDLYRAEIEAEQVRGQINEQRIRIYTAELQGVQTLVDIYKTQVDAVNVEAQVNTSVLEGFASEVRAYVAQVDAQTSKWNGYRAQVDAQLGKATFYSASVDAFGNRVRAWSEGEHARIDGVRLDIDKQRAGLDGWNAKLSRMEAQLKTELARIGVVSDTFRSQTELYKADAQVASAAGEYDNRRFQLNLAQEQAIVDTEMKRSEYDFEQLRYTTTLLSDIKKTIAQVQSQLASAAMSAVNIGASVSSSASHSMGYNLSLSYSGSLDTGEDI